MALQEQLELQAHKGHLGFQVLQQIKVQLELLDLQVLLGLLELLDLQVLLDLQDLQALLDPLV